MKHPKMRYGQRMNRCRSAELFLQDAISQNRNMFPVARCKIKCIVEDGFHAIQYREYNMYIEPLKTV